MVVEVPKRKNLISPLIATAAALGIAQGIFWFILSLLAILFYENEISPARKNTFTTTEVDRTIYDAYLNKELNDITGQLNVLKINIDIIIGPKQFNYFMYFYLVFSFSILVISSGILWAVIREKSGKFYKLRLWLWTINMVILSLLDFILLCLIAHDYHQIKKGTKDLAELPPGLVLSNANITVVLVSVGIVMTLAARGFVLWIINVIFIAIFGKHLYNLQKKGAQPDPSILDAYDTTSLRPPWDLSSPLHANDNRPGYNNKGFRDDNDNPMIISSQSFTHLPLNDRGRDRDNYGNRDKGNQRNQKQEGNYGSQNSNNWNKRSQSDNGLYGLGNSPMRPLSHADRTSDVPNQWGQPTPLRTAKIGRQGGQRSPPLNVNPPFIPDPDYSPPGSPRVRGVLRPKSNYAMY